MALLDPRPDNPTEIFMLEPFMGPIFLSNHATSHRDAASEGDWMGPADICAGTAAAVMVRV